MMSPHRTLLSGVGLAILGCAATPALARVEVTPYIELDQTVTAELKGGNEVLTYTSVSAGVNVSVDTERTQAQLSYEYEYRFGYGNRLGDADYHIGLARVSHQLVPGKVNIEAGAIATRARSDNRGAAPALLLGNDRDNIAQVYSVYAGPTFHDDLGSLEIDAAYRLGYTKVDSNNFRPALGQPFVDGFDDSITHLATASVGQQPGPLPFGWSVSGYYEREDAGQLDQRFESKGVRGDVVVPITPSLAALGGIGYENIEASERAPLFDATGNPVINRNGRFVTDRTSPRLVDYDFDGIYWDVGAEWKPSNRTNLAFHVGRRYGSWSYTGAFTWTPDRNSTLSILGYDQVQTFGQQLNDGLALLPTSFNTGRNTLAPQFNGCVFGGNGGSGGCLNPAFQGISSSVFRSRGITGYYSRTRGRVSLGAGLGYAERLYRTPTIAGAFTLNGLSDKAYFGQGNIGYLLDEHTSLDTSVFGALSQSGLPGSPDVVSAGGTTGISREFGRRLSAHAGVGLYYFDIEDEESVLNAAGQVGVRYSF